MTRKTPCYEIGAFVQVKTGTSDPNYPEILLGGWVGFVCEVTENPPFRYLIHWNDETMQKWRRFWRREIWLREVDLERYDGGPVSIELPASAWAGFATCCEMQHQLPHM